MTIREELVIAEEEKTLDLVKVNWIEYQKVFTLQVTGHEK